jgi:demethylmenaquinone methyltransferase / 2-methoxy-6-polyprenyl-1,4-benzoquinol methylase
LHSSAQADTLPPVAGPEKRRYVFDLFRNLAPEYDKWNRVLSMGMDQPWRRRAVAELSGCRRVCDLGAGTGDMSVALLSMPGFRGRILALDPAPELWQRASGKRALRKPRCAFAVAEGEHLPLADGSCDGVMSGFVMRNFFDFDLAIRECARVVEENGRAVFLEMGHPRNPVWRRLFGWYFGRLMPALFGRVARQAAAYRYLPGSLARFPHQDEVLKVFLANGWRRAEYKEYLGGAVVAYSATK